MRIAISGSYSTGKTLTTLIISELTHFPKTHARTMREILPKTFPGKKLEQCLPNELIELILRRNFERLVAEKTLGNDFVADGGSIQEWAYCYARLKAGFNPNERRWRAILDKLFNYPKWKFFKDMMDAYGSVVQSYAKRSYDLIIYLPIEFPFDPDGHRPTSERFRKSCDKILKDCYKILGLPVYEVTGSIHNRVNDICKILKIKQTHNIKTLISNCQSKKETMFDKIKIELS